MKISPFTPLRFGGPHGSDGTPSRFVQVWSPTDQILIQLIAAAGESAPAAAILDAHTGETFSDIDWQSWQMNAGKVVYFAVLRGLSPGHYRVDIDGAESDEFRVTDDELTLAKTTLIQYRFKDNKQRDDVVTLIDRMPYFFDFRVPGGFKDSGWAFGVSNEQFATQREDLVELFANDYTTKTFTLGGSIGVPVWYGEMLNRLLCCSYVYFDGDRYVRNETEVPSINVLVEGLDSFVFTQVLRKAQVIDPTIEALNQAVLRRVNDSEPDAIYRGADRVLVSQENVNLVID